MSSIPNIPVIHETFPDDYVNDINGWAFDRDTIANNKGKLLTLDIDFGSQCSLNCPFCFRKNNSVDNVYHEFSYDDTVQLIKDAKKLGLRSVKFLGAGEPFETPNIIDFLRILKKLDVIPLLFTKGHIIGDDKTVRRYFSSYGIQTGAHLVEELNRCNASIMLGLNSFDDKVQAKMVGGEYGYISKRNRALKLLVNGGLNSNNPTRLALAVNPIITWNFKGTLELYKWARRRNIYAIITPPMVSGRARLGWDKYTPKKDDLIKLYTDIYKFNLKTNLQTANQLKDEGISAYAGGHPCNQVSTGLYVTLNGIVLSCPGSEDNVEGNIWENSLKDIWINSSNYKRSGKFNCQCVAKDGKTIPENLYDSIYNNIVQSKES